MKNNRIITPLTAILCTLLLVAPGNGILLAQQAPAPPGYHQAPPEGAQYPAPGQALSPDQLEGLVAPIALYPDPLLSQILVASTYPLELVQAYQWLQQNPGLTGPALTQAAQQQSWDPSIQALVIFPDLIKRLNADITWTTNLGNAFLAQQPDVMDAVQHMRFKAQQAGKLSSTPQQNVTTNDQNGQPVIEIQPANPEIIYVPNYDPSYFWGPSLYYPYANWFYPPFIGGGYGYFGFGLGISMGFYLGGGWGGWGGWGWHPGWGNHSLMVNNGFFHRNNFNVGRGGSLRGNSTWSHDASHRGGVPYANAAVASRNTGNVRQNLQTHGTSSGNAAAQMRGNASPSGEGRVGNRQIAPNAPAAGRSAFGGVREGGAAREQSNHGFSSLGPARSGGGGGGGGMSRGGGGFGGGGRGGGGGGGGRR